MIWKDHRRPAYRPFVIKQLDNIGDIDLQYVSP